MTKTAMKRVAALKRSTVRNAPRVERVLSRDGQFGGTKVKQSAAKYAVVKSAAKYYVALKNLAEK